MQWYAKMSYLHKGMNRHNFFFSSDINECAIRNGNCSQICSNSDGSFACYCTGGYVLDIDGKTCNGKSMFAYCVYFVMVILVQTSMNVHQVMETALSCVLTPLEATPVLVCLDIHWMLMEGLAMVTLLIYHHLFLKHSILDFEDVNECGTNNGNCSKMCINAVGSYTCACMTGYALDANGKICNGKCISYQLYLFKLSCSSQISMNVQQIMEAVLKSVLIQLAVTYALARLAIH